jgi:hypothetical protein
VDPSIVINDIRTMESWVAEGVADPRFRTPLLSLFAGVALLMAALASLYPALRAVGVDPATALRGD